MRGGGAGTCLLIPSHSLTHSHTHTHTHTHIEGAVGARASRNLPTSPGDLCLVPYTLGGFGVVFRGCFGVHVRYALDDTDAYSWSDICPHTTQRPVPGPLDQVLSLPPAPRPLRL